MDVHELMGAVNLSPELVQLALPRIVDKLVGRHGWAQSLVASKYGADGPNTLEAKRRLKNALGKLAAVVCGVVAARPRPREADPVSRYQIEAALDYGQQTELLSKQERDSLSTPTSYFLIPTSH